MHGYQIKRTYSFRCAYCNHIETHTEPSDVLAVDHQRPEGGPCPNMVLGRVYTAPAVSFKGSGFTQKRLA